jgi:hypothetical protein
MALGGAVAAVLLAGLLLTAIAHNGAVWAAAGIAF